MERVERKLSVAQLVTHYTSSGQRYPRIPYGDDNPKWGDAPCNDCGASRGQLHAVGECEYEHCPVCRAEQLGTCPHTFVECEDSGLDVASAPTWHRYADRALTTVLMGVILLCILATIAAATRIL